MERLLRLLIGCPKDIAARLSTAAKGSKAACQDLASLACALGYNWL
jgi:hypothetical protein